MIRNACCLVPKGFYFGKHHSVGSIEYALAQARQTEYDTIGFGIQTLASSAQIFRLESDLDSYSLEYELVSGMFDEFEGEEKKLFSGRWTVVHQVESRRETTGNLFRSRPD